MAFRIANTCRPAPTAARRPAKKPAHLAFLHHLPCAVSGVYGVQAAHDSYPNAWHGASGRGKGAKVPDRFALPLSPAEHDLQHSCKLGSERDYWASKGIDPHDLANALWGVYCDYDEAEAIVRCTAIINQRLAAVGALRSREEV
ncbi:MULTISPECIES: DUF968 domain-containing protein [unclassified Ensifer]|uniref:DUF968 domain-containing protein n=1 Tax=unclassified Ensifer TaxID=2633371 RepID=UPI0008139857|nr:MULTISPECIES: DUF968 domain-containing protein [unclassified Ensifer]OCP01323.1 DUF968 domain-containing protein [Ensifer sp. LC14]OCP03215.1 DUF968 domain-containing protein [Ensifer sp. LC11]OCP03585.1 DUF968 domain-containing protein [Ensifer sp. LC13]OCP33998.1 DUF968 domain-containing protein [Ensifer sp. LC499]